MPRTAALPENAVHCPLEARLSFIMGEKPFDLPSGSTGCHFSSRGMARGGMANVLRIVPGELRL